MNFDDIFGNSIYKNSDYELQKAAIILRMREVINAHSADLKRLVQKVEKLEKRIKELEGVKQ